MTLDELSKIISILGTIAMVVCWICLIVFLSLNYRDSKRKERLWKQAEDELEKIHNLPIEERDKTLEEWHKKYNKIRL